MCRGRVRLRRVHDAPWKVPLRSPHPPEWPFAPSVFQPLDAPDTPDEATGRCPPPSHHHINSRGSTGNEEQAESQVLRYVFKKVLHKWHEFSPLAGGVKERFGAPIYQNPKGTYGHGGNYVGPPPMPPGCGI